MEISVFAYIPLATGILVPIILGILGKIIPPDPETVPVKDFAVLEKEYANWHVFIGIAYMMLAFLIGWSLWHGFSLLEPLRRTWIAPSTYLIETPSVWLAPAMVLAIPLAGVLTHGTFVRVLGVRRYAELTGYLDQRDGVNGKILLRGLGWFFLWVGVITVGLCLDNYARVVDDAFIANRFFGLGETRYGFDEIQSIALIKSRQAPNGNIIREPHFRFVFRDGSDYDFRKSAPDLTLDQQAEITGFIVVRTGHEVKIANPFPESDAPGQPG